MLFNMKHPLDLFKYCPKCGSEQFNIHNEKSKKCLNCDFVYYFNPSAATVAVIRGRSLFVEELMNQRKVHWTCPEAL